MTIRTDHHSDFEPGQLRCMARRLLFFWSTHGPWSSSAKPVFFVRKDFLILCTALALCCRFQRGDRIR